MAVSEGFGHTAAGYLRVWMGHWMAGRGVYLLTRHQRR
jgi:hypothetical protein